MEGLEVTLRVTSRLDPPETVLRQGVWYEYVAWEMEADTGAQ